jgi:hypothetical protein
LYTSLYAISVPVFQSQKIELILRSKNDFAGLVRWQWCGMGAVKIGQMSSPPDGLESLIALGVDCAVVALQTTNNP